MSKIESIPQLEREIRKFENGIEEMFDFYFNELQYCDRNSEILLSAMKVYSFYDSAELILSGVLDLYLNVNTITGKNYHQEVADLAVKLTLNGVPIFDETRKIMLHDLRRFRSKYVHNFPQNIIRYWKDGYLDYLDPLLDSLKIITSNLDKVNLNPETPSISIDPTKPL